MSYEYIACQQKRHGVLILSEFAGAAHSLNGALIVNPWNTAETANAILKAVTMTPEVRHEKYQSLSKYIKKFTASHWVSFSLFRDMLPGWLTWVLYAAGYGIRRRAAETGGRERSDSSREPGSPRHSRYVPLHTTLHPPANFLTRRYSEIAETQVDR